MRWAQDEARETGFFDGLYGRAEIPEWMLDRHDYGLLSPHYHAGWTLGREVRWQMENPGRRPRGPRSPRKASVEADRIAEAEAEAQRIHDAAVEWYGGENLENR